MGAIEFLNNLLEKNSKAAALTLIACLLAGSIGGGLFIESLLSRIAQQETSLTELEAQSERTDKDATRKGRKESTRRL